MVSYLYQFLLKLEFNKPIYWEFPSRFQVEAALSQY